MKSVVTHVTSRCVMLTTGASDLKGHTFPMTDDIQQTDEGISGSAPSDQQLNAIELRGLIEKLTQEQNEARSGI